MPLFSKSRIRQNSNTYRRVVAESFESSLVSAIPLSLSTQNFLLLLLLLWNATSPFATQSVSPLHSRRRRLLTITCQNYFVCSESLPTG